MPLAHRGTAVLSHREATTKACLTILANMKGREGGKETATDKKIFLYTFQRYKNQIAGCLTQSHRKLKRERRKKHKPLRIRDTNKQKKREIKRQKLQRAAEKWSTPVKEASIVRP